MNSGYYLIILSMCLTMVLISNSNDKDINDKPRKEKEQYMNDHDCKKVDQYFSAEKSQMVVSFKCPNGKILII